MHGEMESSGLMVLSSAPVSAADASKVPGKVYGQVGLAGTLLMPVGNFFLHRRDSEHSFLTQVFMTLPVLSAYP